MTRNFFFLHSAELHIGSSIRYENALYRNYFFNCYIVKRILISFNCFSEYINDWFKRGIKQVSDSLDIGSNMYQFDVFKETYGTNGIFTICSF